MAGLYTILDRIAEECGPIFEAVNDQVAMRSYRNLVKDFSPEAKMEYRLYRLGTFDNKAIKLVAYEDPVEVIGTEFTLRKMEAQE